MFFFIFLFIWAFLCIVSFHWYVFCLLVVLVKLSVLAKCLASKTPLRMPKCVEGIVSKKPRLKSVHDFVGLLCCFIVQLYAYVCLVPRPT